MTSMCARSLLWTSSPVLASKSETLPDSWPVRIRPGVCANAQTTALLPVGLKNDSGSFGSVWRRLSESQRAVLLGR